MLVAWRMSVLLFCSHSTVAGDLKQLGDKALPAADKVRIARELKAKEQSALAGMEVLLSTIG
jgi:hypothetical protein